MPSQRDTHFVGTKGGMGRGCSSGEPSRQKLLKGGFSPVR
jgi:hypothetical protein